ncbi:MAG: hypothetical protein Q9O24_10050 [Gammaproteobacteria bacterium]|nr:hypothetical protein [Gammaproteobacteria bacterium]
MNNKKIDDFLKQERLPEQYRHTVFPWFKDLADDVFLLYKKADKPLVIGLQGSQGSGKSTLAKLLALLLKPLSVVSLSLDDFYLTHQQRQELAQHVHPLLATRGVPGTHDVVLALRTLAQLQQTAPTDDCLIPRFDKSIDDRLPESEWSLVRGKVDLIILEGWCLGAEAQTAAEVALPINDLEKNEDSSSVWRTYVNDCLADEYQKLFKKIDYLALLNPPTFERVYQWRLLQEQKLSEQSDKKNRLMNETELRRFIQHFERLTQHCLKTLPQRADWCFELDSEHTVVACHRKVGG